MGWEAEAAAEREWDDDPLPYLSPMEAELAGGFFFW